MSGRELDLIEKVRRDAGGAFASGLAYIGDHLGLFGELAHGRRTAVDLAEATGTQPRYVLEWAKAMAAFGYVSHDPAAGEFWLDEAQVAVLADEGSPFAAVGTFQFTGASLLHTEDLVRAFREGGGIRYEELHPDIPPSIDRMHRPWFDHLLAESWIADLPDVQERLHRGIRVLDVGCGTGRSTVALGAAFPASSIVGVDPHSASVASARGLAADRQLENVEFRESGVEELDDEPRYGLALAIDCIHDMSEPVRALAAIRERLAEGGLLIWSEPTGSPNPLENTDALARLRSALSVYHCLTVSLAAGGPGLGTLIGIDKARELARQAGFERFDLLPVRSDTQLFFGLRD